LISSQGGIMKIEQLKEDHQKEIEDIKSNIADIVNTINNTSSTKSQRQAIHDLSFKMKTKWDTDNTHYNSTVYSIADLKAKIAIQKHTRLSLEEKLQKQEEFAIKITEIDTILNKANNSLKKTNTDIELLSTISNILSPTGAPAYIVDNIVDIFNDKVSDYVAMIWPNATYMLQSFKENKSGDIKAKFSDKLTLSGKDISIGSLSGGEYRCLSISIDFAIIDVVETMFGFSISPIFLDEPFDGLDTSNRERVVNLLERLSSDRQIWIIDHASEAKSMFTNTVRIEKENGISSIISQEA